MNYFELMKLYDFLDSAFWRSRDLFWEAGDQDAVEHCRRLYEAGLVVSKAISNKEEELCCTESST